MGTLMKELSSSLTILTSCRSPKRQDMSQSAVPRSSTRSTSSLLESLSCTEPLRRMQKKLVGSPARQTKEPAGTVKGRQMVASCSRKGSVQSLKMGSCASHLRKTLRPMRCNRLWERLVSSTSMVRTSAARWILPPSPCDSSSPPPAEIRICSTNSWGSPEFLMKVSILALITRCSTMLSSCEITLPTSVPSKLPMSATDTTKLTISQKTSFQLAGTSKSLLSLIRANIMP
mmetsp:Transcript_77478/g.185740  ORF Transcript_77478/g.185740 Transcript_77478/m.185740 type:complete len:231 (-) Transcript_77478:6517-7209(-)